MEDIISNQDLISIASKNISIMEKYQKDQGWIANGEVKTDKVCKVYKLNIESRLASKGIVQDVDGKPQEILQLIYDQDFIYKLDPDLHEQKLIRQPTNQVRLSHLRYKGMGPVSDRDFLMIHKIQWFNGKKKFIVGVKSISLPYDLPKGVVRGQCMIGGYIVEEVSENKSRVIYMSDVDIKGMIPDMIKRVLSQNQGSVAGRINQCLKLWRCKKLKHKA